MQLQSFMATLNAIFHVEATPVEGSGSALPLLGNADSRLWVEMCCRGCRAPFSSGHRACLDSQANPSCPEPQLGAAAFPGDFFLVFPFWLYIASSYTVSCQHLRPSSHLVWTQGNVGLWWAGTIQLWPQQRNMCNEFPFWRGWEGQGEEMTRNSQDSFSQVSGEMLIFVMCGFPPA